jgi:DNA-binding CsgD family transcriptional regulator/ribosomal protein S18 acetylase RimI-like enzyme
MSASAVAGNSGANTASNTVASADKPEFVRAVGVAGKEQLGRMELFRRGSLYFAKDSAGTQYPLSYGASEDEAVQQIRNTLGGGGYARAFGRSGGATGALSASRPSAEVTDHRTGAIESQARYDQAQHQSQAHPNQGSEHVSALKNALASYSLGGIGASDLRRAMSEARQTLANPTALGADSRRYLQDFYRQGQGKLQAADVQAQSKVQSQAQARRQAAEAGDAAVRKLGEAVSAFDRGAGRDTLNAALAQARNANKSGWTAAQLKGFHAYERQASARLWPKVNPQLAPNERALASQGQHVARVQRGQQAAQAPPRVTDVKTPVGAQAPNGQGLQGDLVRINDRQWGLKGSTSLYRVPAHIQDKQAAIAYAKQQIQAGGWSQLRALNPTFLGGGNRDKQTAQYLKPFRERIDIASAEVTDGERVWDQLSNTKNQLQRFGDLAFGDGFARYDEARNKLSSIFDQVANRLISRDAGSAQIKSVMAQFRQGHAKQIEGFGVRAETGAAAVQAVDGSTNLLLNATVKVATAGNSGKGFAAEVLFRTFKDGVASKVHAGSDLAQYTHNPLSKQRMAEHVFGAAANTAFLNTLDPRYLVGPLLGKGAVSGTVGLAGKGLLPTLSKAFGTSRLGQAAAAGTTLVAASVTRMPFDAANTALQTTFQAADMKAMVDKARSAFPNERERELRQAGVQLERSRGPHMRQAEGDFDQEKAKRLTQLESSWNAEAAGVIASELAKLPTAQRPAAEQQLRARVAALRQQALTKEAQAFERGWRDEQGREVYPGRARFIALAAEGFDQLKKQELQRQRLAMNTNFDAWAVKTATQADQMVGGIPRAVMQQAWETAKRLPIDFIAGAAMGALPNALKPMGQGKGWLQRYTIDPKLYLHETLASVVTSGAGQVVINAVEGKPLDKTVSEAMVQGGINLPIVHNASGLLQGASPRAGGQDSVNTTPVKPAYSNLPDSGGLPRGLDTRPSTTLSPTEFEASPNKPTIDTSGTALPLVAVDATPGRQQPTPADATAPLPRPLHIDSARRAPTQDVLAFFDKHLPGHREEGLSHRSRQAGQWETAPATAVVTAADGTIVAAAMGKIDASKQGYLEYVAVDTRHQDSKVGRQLVSSIESQLAARGATRIKLLAAADSATPEAQLDAIYGRLGYTKSRNGYFEKDLPAAEASERPGGSSNHTRRMPQIRTSGPRPAPGRVIKSPQRALPPSSQATPNDGAKPASPPTAALFKLTDTGDLAPLSSSRGPGAPQAQSIEWQPGSRWRVLVSAVPNDASRPPKVVLIDGTAAQDARASVAREMSEGDLYTAVFGNERNFVDKRDLPLLHQQATSGGELAVNADGSLTLDPTSSHNVNVQYVGRTDLGDPRLRFNSAARPTPLSDGLMPLSGAVKMQMLIEEATGRKVHLDDKVLAWRPPESLQTRSPPKLDPAWRIPSSLNALMTAVTAHGATRGAVISKDGEQQIVRDAFTARRFHAEGWRLAGLGVEPIAGGQPGPRRSESGSVTPLRDDVEQWLRDVPGAPKRSRTFELEKQFDGEPQPRTVERATWAEVQQLRSQGWTYKRLGVPRTTPVTQGLLDETTAALAPMAQAASMWERAGGERPILMQRGQRVVAAGTPAEALRLSAFGYRPIGLGEVHPRTSPAAEAAQPAASQAKGPTGRSQGPPADEGLKFRGYGGLHQRKGVFGMLADASQALQGWSDRSWDRGGAASTRLTGAVAGSADSVLTLAGAPVGMAAKSRITPFGIVGHKLAAVLTAPGNALAEMRAASLGVVRNLFYPNREAQLLKEVDKTTRSLLEAERLFSQAASLSRADMQRMQHLSREIAAHELDAAVFGPDTPQHRAYMQRAEQLAASAEQWAIEAAGSMHPKRFAKALRTAEADLTSLQARLVIERDVLDTLSKSSSDSRRVMAARQRYENTVGLLTAILKKDGALWTTDPTVRAALLAGGPHLSNEISELPPSLTLAEKIDHLRVLVDQQRELGALPTRQQYTDDALARGQQPTIAGYVNALAERVDAISQHVGRYAASARARAERYTVESQVKIERHTVDRLAAQAANSVSVGKAGVEHSALKKLNKDPLSAALNEKAIASAEQAIKVMDAVIAQAGADGKTRLMADAQQQKKALEGALAYARRSADIGAAVRILERGIAKVDRAQRAAVQAANHHRRLEVRAGPDIRSIESRLSAARHQLEAVGNSRIPLERRIAEQEVHRLEAALQKSRSPVTAALAAKQRSADLAESSEGVLSLMAGRVMRAQQDAGMTPSKLLLKPVATLIREALRLGTLTNLIGVPLGLTRLVINDPTDVTAVMSKYNFSPTELTMMREAGVKAVTLDGPFSDISVLAQGPALKGPTMAAFVGQKGSPSPSFFSSVAAVGKRYAFSFTSDSAHLGQLALGITVGTPSLNVQWAQQLRFGAIGDTLRFVTLGGQDNKRYRGGPQLELILSGASATRVPGTRVSLPMGVALTTATKLNVGAIGLTLRKETEPRQLFALFGLPTNGNVTRPFADLRARDIGSNGITSSYGGIVEPNYALRAATPDQLRADPFRFLNAPTSAIKANTFDMFIVAPGKALITPITDGISGAIRGVHDLVTPRAVPERPAPQKTSAAAVGSSVEPQAEQPLSSAQLEQQRPEPDAKPPSAIAPGQQGYRSRAMSADGAQPNRSAAQANERPALLMPSGDGTRMLAALPAVDEGKGFVLAVDFSGGTPRVGAMYASDSTVDGRMPAAPTRAEVRHGGHAAVIDALFRPSIEEPGGTERIVGVHVVPQSDGSLQAKFRSHSINLYEKDIRWGEQRAQKTLADRFTYGRQATPDVARLTAQAVADATGKVVRYGEPTGADTTGAEVVVSPQRGGSSRSNARVMSSGQADKGRPASVVGGLQKHNLVELISIGEANGTHKDNAARGPLTGLTAFHSLGVDFVDAKANPATGFRVPVIDFSNGITLIEGDALSQRAVPLSRSLHGYAQELSNRIGNAIVVQAHGQAQGMNLGASSRTRGAAGPTLSAEQLTQMVEAVDPDGTRPVCLNSCLTGAEGDSFAQAFSALNPERTVYAPNARVDVLEATFGDLSRFNRFERGQLLGPAVKDALAASQKASSREPLSATSAASAAPLNKTETDLARMLASGANFSEISSQLHLTTKTLYPMVDTLLRRLGVDGRPASAALIAATHQLGLVEAEPHVLARAHAVLRIHADGGKEISLQDRRTTVTFDVLEGWIGGQSREQLQSRFDLNADQMQAIVKAWRERLGLEKISGRYGNYEAEVAQIVQRVNQRGYYEPVEVGKPVVTAASESAIGQPVRALDSKTLPRGVELPATQLNTIRLLASGLSYTQIAAVTRRSTDQLHKDVTSALRDGFGIRPPSGAADAIVAAHHTGLVKAEPATLQRAEAAIAEREMSSRPRDSSATSASGDNTKTGNRAALGLLSLTGAAPVPKSQNTLPGKPGAVPTALESASLAGLSSPLVNPASKDGQLVAGQVRYITTKDITPEALGYTPELRAMQSNPLQALKMSIGDFPQVKVRESQTLLLSTDHSGSTSLVKLGWMGDRAVALRRFVPRADYLEQWGHLADLKVGQKQLDGARGSDLLSRMGIGPQFHGLYTKTDSATGQTEINEVTDVVPGDFQDAVPTNSGAAAAPVGVGQQTPNPTITLDTFNDLETVVQRFKSLAFDESMLADFQYYVTPAGRLMVIDGTHMAGFNAGSDNNSTHIRDRDKAFNVERLELLRVAPGDVGVRYLEQLRSSDPPTLHALFESLDVRLNHPVLFDSRYESYRTYVEQWREQAGANTAANIGAAPTLPPQIAPMGNELPTKPRPAELPAAMDKTVPVPSIDDAEQAGVVFRPGFSNGTAQSRLFGLWMTAGSRELALAYRHGAIADLHTAFAFAADWRKSLAGIELGPEEDNTFGRARGPVNSNLFTPLLSSRYVQLIDDLRANPRATVVDVEGVAVTRLSSTGMLASGETLPLTSVSYPTHLSPDGAAIAELRQSDEALFHKVWAMAAMDEWSQQEAEQRVVAGTRTFIVHTPPSHLERGMDHVDGLFKSALRGQLSDEQYVNRVAKIHWWLGQLAPLSRGSAAASELIARSLLMARGINPSPLALGMSIDLKAIMLTEEQFAQQYRSYFQRDPLATLH